MRILLLSDWMSNRGGAESYIISLRDELRARGDEVRLIACGPHANGAGTTDERAYGSDFLPAQAFLQIVNPFAASRVRAVVREFQPEAAIVSQFAYHLSPAVFSSLGNVPTAVTMMDYKAICATGTRLLPNGSPCEVRRGSVCMTSGCIGYAHSLRDRPRYSRIEREMAARRTILCPSTWMQTELKAAGIEAMVVPLGARSPELRAGQPAPDPVFAYLGRFSREKGVAVLLAAFAQVVKDFPAATLRLIGDGPLRPNLQALAGALRVASSVTFCGWAAAESMQQYLDDAWCVVCPSLWAEPFGLAAVESISLGIPVIASDGGGFRDTVNGLNGIRFSTGDVGSLASAMRLIAEGERFPGARLTADTVERTRTTYGMTEHARRVRDILAELVQRHAT